MSVQVLGMGAAHPEGRLPSQMLEDMDIGTTAEWISQYIGIETRATSLPLDYIRETKNEDFRKAREVRNSSPAELGAQAAEQALKSAGIEASQVGLLVCNCCAPDSVFPTEGQKIAQKIGISGEAYDIFSACPIFALHIDFVNSMRPEDVPDYIMCISSATLTQRVDYNDRSDGAIWGDGAAAWVVSTKTPWKAPSSQI